MKWTRAPRAGTNGWVSGGWTVRGPLMGKAVYWLYKDGQRYTETGRYDDAPYFTTAAEAKAFAERRNGQ